MRYTTICTWFYEEKIGEESKYPQINLKSSSKDFKSIYWKCIVDFFITSLKYNKKSNHEFFTNVEFDNLPIVDNIDLKDFFTKNNIKVNNIKLTYETPKGYYGTWRNQFYIFDILNYINNRKDENMNYMILDSDCIWIKGIDKNILELIDENEVLTYKIPYKEDHIINGLNRMDMKEIFEELEDRKIEYIPYYFGGEIFVANKKGIKDICNLVNDIWDDMMIRNKKNKKKFNEEAHLLSYLYYKLKYKPNTLNGIIRRIWTYPFHYNSNKNDISLYILHMPSEKKYGFNYMFSKINKNKFTFKNDDEYIKWCINNFGVVHRNYYKNIKDLNTFLKKKILNVFKKINF